MRDLAHELNTTNQFFDLVVVGGGIYGICAAREAALQGLSVCLLERGDFGAKTSSNSLKIIHGGLRYLQNLDIRRMRESIRERRAMHRMAPHLVRPMKFVIPCYGHFLRGPEVMAGALAANEIISADRNRGVIPECRIPAGHIISNKTLKHLIPDLPENGCAGGAVWYDGQARNTERLVIAFLEGAQAAGAQLYNYAEATDLLQKDRRVIGVCAIDRLTGLRFEVHAQTVLNAAGPWVDNVLENIRPRQTENLFQQSMGLNLVTRQIFSDHAAAIPFQETYTDEQAVFDKGKLHFFIVPWKQYSLIGTRHLPWEGNPDDFNATCDNVERFVGEINRAYPPARLQKNDIRRVYQGILPALHQGGDSTVQISKRYTIIDHQKTDGVGGIVTMLGVKWTTARDVAERAIKVVLAQHGQQPKTISSTNPLPSGRFGSWRQLLDSLLQQCNGQYDDGILERLAENHGVNARAVLERSLTDPSLAEVIEGEGASPTLGAEIERAIVAEQAHTLEDIVLRRTELAIGGHPGINALEKTASLAGRILDWSPAEMRLEIEKTENALDQTCD